MGLSATALSWGKRAVLGLMAVLLVTFGLRATGSAVARIDLADGSLWLASPPMGSVMQANAASSEVLASVRVGSGSVDVAQAGHSALVLNRASGELGRVDGSTLDYESAPIADGPSGDLQMIGNDHGAYVLDARAGRVLVLDPADRRLLHEVPVPQGPAQLRVDSEGRLWALIRSTGTVVRVEPDGRSVDAGAAPADSDAALVLVDDEPYLVNPDANRVVALDSDTARPDEDHCLGVGRGSGLVATGTSGLERPLALVVDAAAGQLITSDVAEETCVKLSLVGDAQDQPVAFGQPVAEGSLAFIPALDKGQVLVVDLAENQLLQSVQVVKNPNTRFELLVDDGNVWFNSLDTNEAGTLGRDGITNLVLKWGEDGATGPGGDEDALALSDRGDGAVDVEPDTGGVEADRPGEDGDEGASDGDGARAGEGDANGEIEASGAGGDAPEAELEILPADGGATSDLPPVPLPSGPGSAGPGPLDDGSTMRPLPVGPPAGGDQQGRDQPLPGGGQEPDPDAVQKLTPEFTFDPRAPVVGQPVSFFDTSKVPPGAPPANAWSWDFGDGTEPLTGRNVQHVFSSAGTFLVRLTVSNGAETATTVPVSIVVTDPEVPSAPQPDFTFSPQNPEVGQAVEFEGRTLVDPPTCCPVTEWRWDFGDGTEPGTGRTVRHTFTRPGEYLVTLTAVNAASPNFVTKAVNVVLEVEEPVANFEWSPQNPVVGQAVTFRDTSTGGVERRQWSIDGREPTIGVFTYTFTRPGEHRVRLRVENSEGEDRVAKTVTVSEEAQAPHVTSVRVDPDVPEVGELVSLRARAEHGPTSWMWDFADGRTMETAGGERSQVAHQWSSPGVYLVRVTATNAHGSSAVHEQRVVVAEPDAQRLEADFRVSTGNHCLGDPAIAGSPIQFVDASVGGPPVSWAWDFGDGNTGQGPAVSHAYASPGLYHTSLLVTDAQGNEAVDRAVVCVISDQAPVADFSWTPAQPVAGQPVQFNDLSTNSPTRYRWDFGDSTPPSTEANPVHTFAAPGSYRVTLLVAGEGRPTLPRTQTIQVGASVKDPPAAAFRVVEPEDQRIAGRPFTLEDQTPGAVTTPVFSIAGPATAQLSPNPGERRVAYTPPAAGTYTVTMQVCWADEPGNCASTSAPVAVTEAVTPPTASIVVQGANGQDGDKPVVLAGQPVTFVAESPDDGTDYAWNIGGEQRQGAAVEVTFEQTGDVPVTLTATKAGAAPAQDQVVVRVMRQDPPAAQITGPQEGYQFTPLTFTDASTGQPTAWQWSFGDGSTSSEASPQHTYQTPGAYEVTLVVTNQWGTSSPAVHPVTIHPLAAPEPQIEVSGAAPVEGGYEANAGSPLTFTDSGEAPPLTTWRWVWGDGTEADARTVTRSFEAGTYEIVLVARNPAGEAQRSVTLVVS